MSLQDNLRLAIVQLELTLDDDVAMHHDEALTDVILKFKLTMILPEMNVVTRTFIIFCNEKNAHIPMIVQMRLYSSS